jgi:ribosomal protein S18 acetylase RimI-like enzyme
MVYHIRTVRAEDWPQLKELRLAALRDPAARVAFIERYDSAVQQSDDFWRGRATPLAEGGSGTTLIAVDGDRTWAGMLVVLDETAETAPQAGAPGAIDEGSTDPPQAHVVSVYVRTEHRGTGVAEQLLRTAAEWVWAHSGAERIRLWAHGDNARALAFYTRLGFTKTGQAMAFPPVPTETEYELELRRP